MLLFTLGLYALVGGLRNQFSDDDNYRHYAADYLSFNGTGAHYMVG
jgi:hypothetical protein